MQTTVLRRLPATPGITDPITAKEFDAPSLPPAPPGNTKHALSPAVSGAPFAIGFESGDPVSVNGRPMTPAALLAELNERGGRHGVGGSIWWKTATSA
ncbi:UNVERIFIED_ORG: hypothetical protein GGE53_004868 [Rhizobium etli]